MSQLLCYVCDAAPEEGTFDQAVNDEGNDIDGFVVCPACGFHVEAAGLTPVDGDGDADERGPDFASIVLDGGDIQETEEQRNYRLAEAALEAAHDVLPELTDEQEREQLRKAINEQAWDEIAKFVGEDEARARFFA